MTSPFLRKLATVLILVIVLIAAFKTTQPRILNFENFGSGDAQGGRLSTRYVVYFPVGASREFKFLVDGCLEGIRINETRIPPELNGKRHCKSDGAFSFNFEGAIQTGLNEITLEVSHQGDEKGFANLAIGLNTPAYFFFYGLFALLTAYFMGLVWSAVFRSPLETRLIWLWGFLVFAYAAYTPWDTRANDPIDHFDYILEIYNNRQLPAADRCFQCFQSPGYYLLAAFFFKFAVQVFHCVSFSVFMVQYLGLWLFFAFLIGLRKTMLEVARPAESLPLLVFSLSIPTMFLHAPRLGNDNLFYVGGIWTVLYAQRFWQAGRARDLQWAFAFLILALLAKATALLLLAGTALVLLFALRERKGWRPYAATIAVGVAAFGALYVSFNEVGQGGGLFRINRLAETLRVEREWYHFLTLNPATFFDSAQAEPLAQDGGREFYWEYFLKSFSHAEFPIRNPINVVAAHLRNVLTFALLIFSAWLWWRRPRFRKAARPLLIFSLTLFVGHFCYQLAHPFSSSADARLIYFAPLLIFFPLMAEKSRALRYFLWAMSLQGALFLLTFLLSRTY